MEVKNLQYEYVAAYSEEKNGGIWRVMGLDEHSFVSASHDHYAKIWRVDYSEGALDIKNVKILPKYQKEVLSIAKVSDGVFVTGSSSGKMTFWKDDGSFAGSLEENRGSVRGFYSLIAMNEETIVTGACQKPKQYRHGNWNHVIKIWNCSLGCIDEREGHTGGVAALTKLNLFNFASCSGDGTVRVWSLENKQTSCAFSGHEDYVYGLTNIDESRLISCSKDRTIRVWDVTAEKGIGQLTSGDGIAHTSTVYDVKNDGQDLVVSGSRDGFVKVWDLRTSECVKSLDAEDGFVYGVDFLKEEKIIAGTSGKKEGRSKDHKNNAHVVAWDLRVD